MKEKGREKEVKEERMSQDKVFNLLKKQGSLTTIQISDRLGICKSSTSGNLKRLCKQGVVERVKIGYGKIFYRIKRDRTLKHHTGNVIPLQGCGKS